MTQKDIRIRSNEELETQVLTLKKYYGVKSKAGAIKKAIKDTAMVAQHNYFTLNEDLITDEILIDIKNYKGKVMVPPNNL